MKIKKLTTENAKKLESSRPHRVVLAKRFFYQFLSIYMRHRFPLVPADFHGEMIEALDSIEKLNKYIGIMGFRGSAKTTFLEAFATWCMINGKHNFINYIGQTVDKAKMSIANIRDEIESNELLRKDFGILLEDGRKKSGDKWADGQLTIKDCTIVAKSRGAKGIRGSKFKEARLDLIICDDLEDREDADTVEKRKATRMWFFSEVMPATKQGELSKHVKVVMLGNLVNRDCLLVHFMKSEFVRAIKFGIYKEDGSIAWPALYPNEEAVQDEKAKVLIAGEGLGQVIWAREYLLKEVDEEDMVLKLSDIKYYPDEWLQRRPEAAGVGVDFAISQKQTADYTAMCKGVDVKNDEGERRLLIMPGAVEKRMGFEQTIKTAVEINEQMPHGTKFYPEKVGYQESAHEIMKKNGLTVVPMQAVGDKKARIESACYYVKSGRVLFPRTGAENVIANLTGFGIEEHDDLADAFAYLVLGIVKKSGGLWVG